MKILFSMRNFWYVKHYETVLQELARRGHDVVIASEHQYRDSTAATPWNAAAEALAAATPNVRVEWMPAPPSKFRRMVTMTVRSAGDYVRFLLPRYRDTPRLGTKARRIAPWVVRRLTAVWPFASPNGLARLTHWLRRLEDALPIDRNVAEFLDRQRPDVVLITPLVTLASEQLDLLRSARRRGIHALVAVGSWDHLSSKALIRLLPDRLMVWNGIQEEEARVLHDVPAERVAVTGAQSFDHWFTWQPSRSREAFLRDVGLPADRPYVLYACSSLLFGSPAEAPFVLEWAKAVRRHPGLAHMSILVRPHPKRSREWGEIDLGSAERLRVWPPLGAAPITASTRDDYFDTLYYASAVVGLNTTAFIEAGIVGRPVLTVILPEYRDNQEGTLHFRYLTEVGGGLLDVAYSMEAHLEQLLGAVTQGGRSRRAFLEAFVRPRGLSVPATTVFADAVEDAVRVPVLAPQARRVGLVIAAMVLWSCVLLPMIVGEGVRRVRYAIKMVLWRRREALQVQQKEAARVVRVAQHHQAKQAAAEQYRARQAAAAAERTERDRRERAERSAAALEEHRRRKRETGGVGDQSAPSTRR